MIITKSLDPLSTDKAFADSPDTGLKQCVCSRCGCQIQEFEHPIRIWTTNGKGKVDQNSLEYRYCQECTTGIKYFYCEDDMAFGMKCQKQCESCKDGK